MDNGRINILGVVYSAIIALTLVMFVLSIPYGAYAIFSPNLSTSVPPYTYQTLVSSVPIYIGLFTVSLPLTPSFGILFVSLTALFSIFIALAFVQGGGFIRALRSASREGVGALLQNPLSATIMILGATLLATIVLDLFQNSVGVSAGGLSGDPYDLLVSFTLAPLIEEVGFRFFLIGVPLFIVLLLTRSGSRRMLKSLWRPSAAWEAEPGEEPNEAVKSSLRLLVYFLIALSSILFGLAHYLSGAGWDIGKVSEAALDGVALAYLYVRYGLHASIIFHWAVDFASNAFAFYGQAAYGISWTSNSVYSVVPTIDIVILVGLPGLLYFANLFFKRVINTRGQVDADDSNRQIDPDGTSR
ncbi:MAG: CPBP family intramembrane metalloprotease [Thaumarchaeota archaeon]|nr:CPBP family intramembrane metalloprotease [Nitrososphaerota archaeon]